MDNIVWNEVHWCSGFTDFVKDCTCFRYKYMDKYPDDNEKVFVKLENGDIKTAIYDGYDFGEYDREDIDAWAKIPEEFKE